eukprot:7893534-Lingulodinium_polyedra.AAC.1
MAGLPGHPKNHTLKNRITECGPTKPCWPRRWPVSASPWHGDPPTMRTITPWGARSRTRRRGCA